MARDITVTFADGSQHIYQGAPDNVTPEQVEERARKEFGKDITHLDRAPSAGAKGASPRQYLEQKASEIGKAMVAPIKADLAEDKAAYEASKKQNLGEQIVSSVTNPFGPGGVLRAGKEAADVVSGLAYPVNEPINRLSGAVNKATGGAIDLNTALAALGEGAALKVGEAAKAARGVTELADADKAAASAKPAPLTVTNSEVAQHASSVANLTKEGVDLTSGQRAGGITKRLEESQKSNPLIGQAIREREQNALDTYNMATYNQVLKPLGVRLKKGPVGREGIDLVNKIISDRYDRIMPKLTMRADPELAEDVADIKSKLLQSQQGDFAGFIKERVIDRMKNGTLTGRDFKSAESEISNMARSLMSSPDGAQRALGQAFEDSLHAMRDSLERHSAPDVRDELKKINTAYAGYARLETAAANRAGSFGKFSTGDLLAAVKREDKSRRKGSFARGDALLGEWADAGHRVLRNVVPDSGTPERLRANGWVGAGLGGALGGIPGAIVGAAGEAAASSMITPLAKNMMARHAQSMVQGTHAIAPTGPNFLRRVTNGAGASAGARSLAAGMAGRSMVNAVDQSPDGQQ